MNWPLIVAALAAAGFAQGLTGFGFGLISMSLLPAAMGDIKRAAAFSTIYGLLVTIATFVRYLRDYNWRLGLPFLISSCIGVPLGVIFLEKCNPSLVLKIFGLLMVALAAREFLVKQPLQTISTPLSVPFGLFSGSLSGAFNLGGIPTASYAYAHDWSRGQIMAFLQMMLVTSCSLRLLLYSKFGYFVGVSWLQALFVLVPVFIAMAIGHRLVDKVPGKTMRRFIFIFIGGSGICYLLMP